MHCANVPSPPPTVYNATTVRWQGTVLLTLPHFNFNRCDRTRQGPTDTILTWVTSYYLSEVVNDNSCKLYRAI